MMDLTMTIELPDGLMNLSQEFQAPIEEFSDAAAEYIRDIYKYYIDQAGAIRSGAFLQSVHVEEGPSGSGEHRKYVIADVPYAKVVEIGWIERGQGQTSYPGRYPAQDAIEFVLASLESGLAGDALKARLKHR
jgi:hypothetical protein